jgi:hypothetical protein
MSAEYEAGRILHDAWHNVGRAIAPPFDLIDQFDRLRWIEAAKISNAAEREACAKLVDLESRLLGKELQSAAAIRARGNA